MTEGKHFIQAGNNLGSIQTDIVLQVLK